MGRYPARRRLDGQEQSTRLLAALPTFRRVARGNPYVWEGTIRPTELSDEYRVRITHDVRRLRPDVEVIDPKLVTREDGKRIPHTFSRERLCLHLPAEWHSSMFIHQTIVPWASLWLYYYEVWHATGLWLGGGHEPPPKDADVDS
jgi:hypothetical protein